jgi:translocation protein SEC63
MAEQVETTGSTPMFAIFLLSMYSLFLIPITLYKLSGGSNDEAEVVKTWSTKNNKRDKQGKLLKHLRTVFSTRMMLAWLAWALLLW